MQELATADAATIVQTLQTLPLSVTASSSLLTDAYDLATTYQRTVYDMMYVALSVREQCQLVTADERLYNALIAHFPLMVWVGN